MATTINAPIKVSGSIANPAIIPSNFELVESVTYPDGKTYSGPAERCFASFTFLPANWPGSTWFIDHLIAKHMADKLSAAGAKPLNFKLYGDGFDYIMVIEAAKPVVQSAVGIIQIAWSVIVLAALVLAALIVIFFIIKVTEDFIYKSPGAAIGAGVILLGIAGLLVVGLAIYKGSSVKGAITGQKY